MVTRAAAPAIRCVDNVFVFEPGPESSHLYESQLDELAGLSVLADSVTPARIVVDLSNVKFMGSAAIGQFVAASQTLARRGGRLALAGTSSYCRAAIELTHLASLLPSFDSTEAAVCDLNSSHGSCLMVRG